MFHFGNSVPGHLITRSKAGTVLITLMLLRGLQRKGTWEAQVREPRNRMDACFGLPFPFLIRYCSFLGETWEELNTSLLQGI